jgi:hypothetical protein
MAKADDAEETVGLSSKARDTAWTKADLLFLMDDLKRGVAEAYVARFVDRSADEVRVHSTYVVTLRRSVITSVRSNACALHVSSGIFSSGKCAGRVPIARPSAESSHSYSDRLISDRFRTSILR